MAMIMASDFTEVPDGEGSLEEDLSKLSLLDQIKKKPVRTSLKLIEECEKAMTDRIDTWARYRSKYRRGLKYSGQSSSSVPLYPTNYIFNVIETLKANVVSNLPAIVAKPVEEGDDVASAVFSKIIDVALKRAKLREKSEQVVHHGGLTGVGWFKAWFNPDEFYGKGDVAIEVIAPEDLLMLGNAVEYERADVFIHRRRDVSEAEIKAVFEVDGVEGRQADKSAEDRSISSANRKVTLFKTWTIYEIWIKDWDTHNWWITTIAGSTCLKKPEKSEYKHNSPPFVPWFDITDLGADQAHCIGVGEVEEIESLQDLSDVMDMRIYKNIRQITSRQRVLNPASGISRTDLDDTPNRVYLCSGRPQDAIMWDNPPVLGQDVFNYREKIEDRIQTVTGVFDVTQGQKPSGIQAARAISALQQAAAMRLEFKKMGLKKSQTLVAHLIGSMILQYYTEERIVRISGNEVFKIVGDYPDSVKNPGAMESEAFGVGNGMEAMMGTAGMSSMAEQPMANMGGMPSPMTNAQPGQPSMELPYVEEPSDEEKETDIEVAKAQWKEENGIDLVLSDIDFKYDLEFTSDTGLPANREERTQLIMDMFRLGILDRKAALDGIDFPDREAILRRLEPKETGKTPPEMSGDNQAAVQQQQQAEMEQAQMEAQLEQQGQPPPEMPPGM